MKQNIKSFYKKGYIYSLIFILIFTIFVNFHKNVLLKEYYSYTTLYLETNKINIKYLNATNTFHLFIESNESENADTSYETFHKMFTYINQTFDSIIKKDDYQIDDQFLELKQLLDTYETYATSIYMHENDTNLSYITTLEDKISVLGQRCYANLTNDIGEYMQIVKINKTIITITIHILLILLFIWLLYFFRTLSKKLILPLDHLISDLDQIQNSSEQLQTDANAFQEIQNIVYSLNTMLKKLDKAHVIEMKNEQLEKQLLTHEMHLARHNELLSKSELKMLQNQINPHFLFNTLNMINGLILTNQSASASSMILKTSSILRYGLDVQNSTSTLEKEYNIACDYIDIQKERFSKRIDFILNVCDMSVIKNVPMPGMILQPLIENAIKHGVQNMFDDAEIELYIQYTNDVLTIEVSDNGCGMDQEDIDKKIELYHSSNYDEPHLGLYNVIRRLELFYGKNVNISITTAINCGFSFQITITLKEGVDHATFISRR